MFSLWQYFFIWNVKCWYLTHTQSPPPPFTGATSPSLFLHPPPNKQPHWFRLMISKFYEPLIFFIFLKNQQHALLIVSRTLAIILYRFPSLLANLKCFIGGLQFTLHWHIYMLDCSIFQSQLIILIILFILMSEKRSFRCRWPRLCRV